MISKEKKKMINCFDFNKNQYYDNEQSDKLAEFFKDKVSGFKNCQIAVFNNLLHLFSFNLNLSKT